MAQRIVDGPEKMWLTATEAAQWLAIGDGSFRRLIEEGKLPEGKVVGEPLPETKRPELRWNWLDLVAYSHLVGRNTPVFLPSQRTVKKP